MPDNKPQKATARNPVPDSDRAVLRKREVFWRVVFQWSALGFFLAVGVSAIGWTYWAGQGSRLPRAWFGLRARPEPAAVAPEADIGRQPPERRRALDGQALAEDDLDGPYYAVMIDNHYDARPQAGLSQAALVYDVPVEGGLNRFMAIYSPDDLVERIGPVRSARPYYLDWAAELDVLYAHVGGSPESLATLRQDDWRDLNEFWNGRYFWRDLNRWAPHNVYTSVGLLGKAWSAKFADRLPVGELTAWNYKDELDIDDRPLQVPNLVIDYSSAGNEVVWEYDRKRNVYERHMAGKPHLDEDGSPIRAKNVIVQYHKISVIDSIGRLRIDTLGEGPAYILNNGQVTEAVWQKEDGNSRTRYLTVDGDEVFLNVGYTWVQVVPLGLELEGVNRTETEP